VQYNSFRFRVFHLQFLFTFFNKRVKKELSCYISFIKTGFLDIDLKQKHFYALINILKVLQRLLLERKV